MGNQGSVNLINEQIKSNDIDRGLISDGYHTFSELYEHRNRLFMVLCKSQMDTPLEDNVYKTRFDFEGKYCGDDWFIMGIYPPRGYDREMQISYHLPYNLWDECMFAKTVDKVPAFDGHTAADVLQRLKKFY